MCPGCRFVSGRSLVSFSFCVFSPRAWKIGKAINHFTDGCWETSDSLNIREEGRADLVRPSLSQATTPGGKEMMWRSWTMMCHSFNLKASFCQESARKIVSWTVHCCALLWESLQPGGPSPGWGRAGVTPWKRFRKWLGGAWVTRFRGWREGSCGSVGFQWSIPQSHAALAFGPSFLPITWPHLWASGEH